MVTRVADATEADIACGLLRSAGIECGHRETDAIDSTLEDFTAARARTRSSSIRVTWYDARALARARPGSTSRGGSRSRSRRLDRATLSRCTSSRRPCSRAPGGSSSRRATFRRLALASAFWLWLIVVIGRDRPPDQLRPRLRALARLHRGQSAAEQELPLVHRVRQPARQRADDPRDARRVVRRTLHARAAALGAAARARDVPRHARAGAARRDHGLLGAEPVARHVALPPRADVVLAAGVVVAVEAVSFERGRSRARLPLRDPARRVRRAQPRCSRSSSAGRSRPPPARIPAARTSSRLWRLHAAVYVHVRATAIFGVLFLAVLRLHRAGTASGGRSTPRARQRCSSCCCCRWASESFSTGRTFPGGSCSSTSALAAAVWACAVALVAAIERPPKPFAPHGTHVHCLDGR